MWLVCATFLALLGISTTLSPVMPLRRPARSLRWYSGSPARIESFLLDDNPKGYLNSTTSVSKYTDGVYECCNGMVLEQNGTVTRERASWNVTRFEGAGLRMFMTIVPRVTCDGNGKPRNGQKSCVSPGDVCRGTLKRTNVFIAGLLAEASTYKLQGFHLDWEYGYGNDIPCQVKLWTDVTRTLRAHNLQLALSVNDVGGRAPFAPTAPSWGYLTDWKQFVSYADVLIDMGTYPLTKIFNHTPPAVAPPPKERFAAANLLPVQQKDNRWTGMEGHVLDFVRNGANASSGQYQPAVQAGICSGDGVVTDQGWTQPALEHFLNFSAAQGVHTVVVWTSDAFLVPSKLFTCPWFIDTLVKWAQEGDEPGGMSDSVRRLKTTDTA